MKLSSSAVALALLALLPADAIRRKDFDVRGARSGPQDQRHEDDGGGRDRRPGTEKSAFMRNLSGGAFDTSLYAGDVSATLERKEKPFKSARSDVASGIKDSGGLSVYFLGNPCDYNDYCNGCICRNLPRGIIRKTSAEAEVIFMDVWLRDLMDVCSRGGVANIFERYPLRSRGRIYFVHSNGLYDDPCGRQAPAAVRTPEDREFVVPGDGTARDRCACWQAMARRPDFFFYNIESKMHNQIDDDARPLPGVVIPMYVQRLTPVGEMMMDSASHGDRGKSRQLPGGEDGPRGGDEQPSGSHSTAGRSSSTAITDLLRMRYFLYFWGTPNPGMHGGPSSRIQIAQAFQSFYEERHITNVSQLQGLSWTRINGSDELGMLDPRFAPAGFENRVVVIGTGSFTLAGDPFGSDNGNTAQRSLYCLHMRGHTRESSRFQKLVAAGCIPVILANGLTLPFSQLIDWEPMILRLDERKFLDQPATSLVRAVRKHLRQHLPDAESFGELPQYYQQGLSKVPKGKRLNVLEMRARLVRTSNEYFSSPGKVSKSWLRALRAEMQTFHWV